jgi:protein SCO1/2
MPKILKVLVVVVMLSTLATVVLLQRERVRSSAAQSGTTNAHAHADPLRPDDRLKTLSIPDFALTTQDEQPITREALKGRITIVDFIFTHCPFICPTLTARMSELSATLSDTGVRFLSVSVDPKHDTPARLREYAKLHSADTSRWTFATGPIETVRSIVTGGLKFDLGDDPSLTVNLPDGTTMNNIRHPSWLALIGPNAEVLGIYLAAVPEDMAELERRARAASLALGKRP